MSCVALACQPAQSLLGNSVNRAVFSFTQQESLVWLGAWRGFLLPNKSPASDLNKARGTLLPDARRILTFPNLPLLTSGYYCPLLSLSLQQSSGIQNANFPKRKGTDQWSCGILDKVPVGPQYWGRSFRARFCKRGGTAFLFSWLLSSIQYFRDHDLTHPGGVTKVQVSSPRGTRSYSSFCLSHF